MVAGHLQEKKGLYYMVLSYKDKSGKRISKWLPTGLPVKGNKKRAEDMLMAARAEFVAGEAAIDRDMPFSSYLVQWMEIARSTLKPNTAAGYASMIQNPIAPYFQQRGITLGGLQAVDIQMFYTSQLKRVSANTVIHYHAIIHRALKYAVKTDLIDVNPADKVERPRKDRFTASFYDGNEVNRLFRAARGTPLELPVMLAAFYGLRRSEVVGLKWDAIDFENKTIAIRHTVTVCAEKGRRGGRLVALRADAAGTEQQPAGERQRKNDADYPSHTHNPPFISLLAADRKKIESHGSLCQQNIVRASTFRTEVFDLGLGFRNHVIELRLCIRQRHYSI